MAMQIWTVQWPILHAWYTGEPVCILVCKQILTIAHRQMYSGAFADRQMKSAADGYLVAASDWPAEFFLACDKYI